MEPLPLNPTDARWLRLAGGLVLGVALLVIAGWLAGVHALVAFVPGGSSMVMNTALCLLGCGAGVLAVANGRGRAARACGWAVAVFAAVVGLQFIVGRSLGVDNLFWHHGANSSQGLIPGRMAPNTVVALVLTGLGLALMAARRARPSWITVCGVGVLGFAVLPLLSYLASLTETGASYRGMSLPTMISLVLLGWAMLWWVSRQGREREMFFPPLMAAAISLLLAIGVVSLQSNAELVEARRRVDHAHQVVVVIERVVARVARMESNARGYAMTGRETMRASSRAHESELLRLLGLLEGLVAGDAEQHARALDLSARARQKIAHNASVLEARTATGGLEAPLAILSKPSEAEANGMIDVGNLMKTEETRQLERWQAESEVLAKDTRATQVFGGLIALALVALTVSQTRRSTLARRAAEEDLRTSETRFRSAFEHAGIGMALVGLDGRWLRVNRAICQIVGYAEAELLQKTFQDITHPDDLEADLGHVRALIAGTGSTYDMEKRYFHRDGHVVWIHLTVSLVRDAAGRPVHFISQIEDITARKLAEQALRKSEQMFQRLFESSPDAIVLVDRAGRIARANARAESLFGWADGTLAGQPLDALLPERLRARHGGHLAEYFRNPRARSMGAGLELFGRRRDASEFPVDIMLSPVETDAGQQVLAVVRDITVRKQLETELRVARDEALAASRLKSEFLATVSHEIRTPMNGILGMADLLVEANTDPEHADMARIIQRSAEGLLAIINDLLDFSKIEAGKLRLEPQEFDLRGLVEETVALVAPRAQQKHLALACEIAPALAGRFLGDAGRIRQVLTNLLGNAIKFTERGGVKVQVQAVAGDHQARAAVRMSVTDTGIGIPPEVHGRLFQPFTQADGSATRRFGGTGLGLAISRQLVALMGGEIGFTSEAGRGSTFWFELSLTRVATPAGPSAPPVAPPPAPARMTVTKGMRLLLVDDNQANQAVARLLLERMGCVVTVAEHGRRALELLERGRFDVVLMDCQMPVLDGYETTRRIRSGRVPGVDSQIPVIALTAYAMADDRAKCLAAGMDDYVSKPVREAELLAAFQRCGLLGPSAADVLDARVVAMVRALPGRDGASLWPETVALFLREEPRWLEELDRLATARAVDGLAGAAHTLASSCASLGAAQMRTAALALERAARAADWVGVEARLAEVRAASARLRAALKKVEVAAG